MPSTLFSTPRAEPGHLLPTVGGTVVLAVALPVFVIAGWSVAGWALAAALWFAVHVLDLFVARARTQSVTLAGSGVQAFALFFKSIGLLAVLLAALAADRELALSAVVTYGLAYTFELGLSLVSYFGAERR